LSFKICASPSAVVGNGWHKGQKDQGFIFTHFLKHFFTV
jgi:hypothetical protein